MSEQYNQRTTDQMPYKAMSFGHILVTISLCVGAFWFVADMRTDIAVLKSQDTTNKSFVKEIRADIKDIKDYLIKGN